MKQLLLHLFNDRRVMDIAQSITQKGNDTKLSQKDNEQTESFEKQISMFIIYYHH